jgi:hypothetical protein
LRFFEQLLHWALFWEVALDRQCPKNVSDGAFSRDYPCPCPRGYPLASWEVS